MKNICRLGLFLIILSTLSGCVAVVAGGAAGAVAYVRGELNTAVESPINDVNDAVIKMADELEFIVYFENQDGISGSFKYENSLEEKIVIKTALISSNVTEIRIRVGYFGDESLSLQLLDRIKSNLD